MSVIDRLLESDPAIRRQGLRDLTDAAPDEVAAERARVEREGWGARLLALQGWRRVVERWRLLPGVLHRRLITEHGRWEHAGQRYIGGRAQHRTVAPRKTAPFQGRRG
ncbi:hypothetical protein ACFPOI_58910 [Nonomuraea angiospora]|uniref:Sirohydrochlorin ferrochelatase n=1 Tax=Nonomuraea angiospora TaxID=46172 RepID=A0ABR9LQS7_9ACTN|nr:hypothetical protein [Nonomuraea angiospora]MBE1582977.1 sirohydrochlorin ferrochelatase [Nonomuraea angiospora]